MFDQRFGRRAAVMLGIAALIAGCKVIPKGPAVSAPEPVATEAPSNALPTDKERHRIALLVHNPACDGAT